MAGSLVLRVVQGSAASASGIRSQRGVNGFGWIWRWNPAVPSPSPTRCCRRPVQRALSFFPTPSDFCEILSPGGDVSHSSQPKFCQLHRVPRCPLDPTSGKRISLLISGTLIKSFSVSGPQGQSSYQLHHSTSEKPGAQGVRTSPMATSQ